MEALIFVGLQACGKTTFCRERFYGTHIRLSMDMLKTRHREKILFDACLAAKQPVVIDNTNPSPAERQRYIEPAKTARFRVVGYYFQSRIEDCKARNARRSAKEIVPTQGLLGTYNRLTRPTLAEGFDQLWYVRIGPDEKFVIEEWCDEV